MAKVLLADDDEVLCSSIRDWLVFEKHIVEVAGDGESALALLSTYTYDIIILDWEMPKLSGLEVCRRFRARGGCTPILFLTGRDAVIDKEAGLDSGADDYITKPFHVRELSARVRALLRRPAGTPRTVLKAGDLEMDPSTRKVLKRGKEIDLPRQEFALLEFFMRNVNRVLSQELIMERVWSTEFPCSPETFRTCLKKLRGKVDDEGSPSIIKNLHGVGYILEVKE
jgi:two-component system, OmpR family, response regulator MprA